MGDALDRAAQAIYEAAFRAAPDAPWKTWDTIPEDWRKGYRRDAAAALTVMADDIRGIHKPSRLCLECDEGGCDNPSHLHMAICAECCRDFNGVQNEDCADHHMDVDFADHCRTTWILDTYAGGGS